MTTVDRSLSPTTSQLPSSANLRAKPRMSGSASAAPGSPATASRLFQAFSAKWDFSIALVSVNGGNGGRVDRFSRAIHRMACSYFAIEPCSDNEHDPTDQDSRTSFPDKDPSEPSRWQKITVSSSDSSRSNPIQPAGSWRDIGQGSHQDEC
jgi:hypothetical protein